MRNFISYVAPGDDKLVRVVELATMQGLPPVGNSLAGISQEVACVECVTRMSRINAGFRFSWGHEESDGRTWLHGTALDGEYRSIGGSQIRKRRVRELITTFDGEKEGIRAVSDSDPFEINIDRPPFDDWAGMLFKLDGVEVATIYKGGK